MLNLPAAVSSKYGDASAGSGMASGLLNEKVAPVKFIKGWACGGNVESSVAEGRNDVGGGEETAP